MSFCIAIQAFSSTSSEASAREIWESLDDFAAEDSGKTLDAAWFLCSPQITDRLSFTKLL